MPRQEIAQLDFSCLMISTIEHSHNRMLRQAGWLSDEQAWRQIGLLDKYADVRKVFERGTSGVMESNMRH